MGQAKSGPRVPKRIGKAAARKTVAAKRLRRTPSGGAGGALTRAKAPGRVATRGAGTLTLRSREVVEATAEIVSIGLEAGRNDVEARVTMGERLRWVRDELQHGEWLRWVEGDVPFTDRSARSYIRLYDWSRTHVAAYQRLAPLGVTKLYLLIRIRGEHLATLLKRKRHTVPGSGAVRTLEGMTYKELVAVVRELAVGSSEQTAAGEALSACRRGVRAVAKAAESLVAHRASVARQDVVALHAALLQTADRLASGYGLSV